LSRARKDIATWTKRYFAQTQTFAHMPSLDKSTIFGKKDYWNVLEVLPKFHPAAADSVRNVSDLSQVKTVLGRGRAWIRFALIEKNLEEYLRVRRNQFFQHLIYFAV